MPMVFAPAAAPRRWFRPRWGGVRALHGVLLTALWAGTPGGVQADPLLDFGLFDVPPQAQRAQSAPLVTWLVRPDAAQYCATAQPQDGHAIRHGECAYWQLKQGRCTIVTTASTTHSQLGHLFLHCLTGK